MRHIPRYRPTHNQYVLYYLLLASCTRSVRQVMDRVFFLPFMAQARSMRNCQLHIRIWWQIHCFVGCFSILRSFFALVCPYWYLYVTVGTETEEKLFCYVIGFTKWPYSTVHTYPDSQRIKKFPLCRADSKSCGFACLLCRMRVDRR